MAEAVTALDYRGNITEPTEASNSGVVSAPGALATITSVSLVPGTYTLAWTVGLTAGTPAAADANNFGLYVGATRQEASVNPGALGEWQQQSITLTLTANTTVAVESIGAATAGVGYSAELTATPIPVTDPTGQLQPFNALTANGNAVTLGSGQSVTLAGFDVTDGYAECQLGRGGNIPSGSSDVGFVDTTYTLTAAQVQAGSQMGA